MPGFGIWYNPVTADIGPDARGLLKVANSQTWYGGEPLVKTTVTGSEVRLRMVAAGDISGGYLNGSDICGVYGIAKSGLATDASGNFTTVPSTVTLAGGVKPVYPLLSVEMGNPTDPATGRARANVFTCQNVLSGYLWENTTVTAALQETAVGLLLSTISSVPYFFWSTAAATKIGVIHAVAEDDPYFNKAVTANVQDTTHYSRCVIAVRVLESYDQSLTVFNYAN